ncbi:hypothetical protein G6F43_010595 [Rhizopus delemar]|nr:hypothetical protein G6F43_010595 [Rhizopus delemar]
MRITIKKPHFDAEARYSFVNLRTRYEWFMDWKESHLSYTNNCVFIDEAGFRINVRKNWARSPAGACAVVKTAKTRVASHSVIGAVYSSTVIHVVLKNPSHKPEADTVGKRRERFWTLQKGKMKRQRLMKEETLSSRIGDAYNAVRFSELYGV